MIKISKYDSGAFRRERTQADADVSAILKDVEKRGDAALYE